MPPNDILDPDVLAGDLRLIREAYASLLASIDPEVLLHSAQIADPAGVPPLWTRFDDAVQHRLISRLMLAFSLLDRLDLADGLRDAVAFRVGGPGGGEWYLDLRPDGADWHEAPLAHPGLSLRMRSTATLFRMATQRIRMPIALATGEIRVRGHLRLFTGLGRLTSVDAHPNAAGSSGSSAQAPKATLP